MSMLRPIGMGLAALGGLAWAALTAQEPAKPAKPADEARAEAKEESAESALEATYDSLVRLNREPKGGEPKHLLQQANRLYRQAIEAYEQDNLPRARRLAQAARELSRSIEIARSATQPAPDDADLPPPPTAGRTRTRAERAQSKAMAKAAPRRTPPAPAQRKAQPRAKAAGREPVEELDRQVAELRAQIDEQRAQIEAQRSEVQEQVIAQAREAAEQAVVEARRAVEEAVARAHEAEQQAQEAARNAEEQARARVEGLEHTMRERAERADEMLQRKLAERDELARNEGPERGDLEGQLESKLAEALAGIEGKVRGLDEEKLSALMKAARDLAQAARRDAEAGRGDRARELARAAEALAGVPRMLQEAGEPMEVDDDAPRAGLGLQLGQEGDEIKVVAILPGGAAAEDGRIQPGDVLVGVEPEEGELVEFDDMEIAEVGRLVQGEPGTKVRIVVRRGEGEPQTFEIERKPIPSPADQTDEEARPDPEDEASLADEERARVLSKLDRLMERAGAEADDDDRPAGLGLQLEVEDDQIVVGRVVPGGAAAVDGRIEEHDVLVGIVGEDGAIIEFAADEIGEVARLIQGQAGSELRLVVRPGGEDKTITYKIKRLPLPMADDKDEADDEPTQG